MTKVVIGMHAQTAVEQKQLVMRCLTTTALQAFNSGWDKAVVHANDEALANARATHEAAMAAATTAQQRQQVGAFAAPGPVDPATYNAAIFLGYAIDEIIRYVAPHKALPKVKRFLRRNCRKPYDMKVREFWNHLQRINDEELPSLPPFDADQKLSSDEIIDILLFAFPKSWQNEMERQGFDPYEKTIPEILDLCERLENLEATTPPSTKKSNNNKGKKQPKGNADKYCLLHGPGSHNTDECKVLMAQAKKMKSSNDDSGGYQKRSGNYQNKSWNRKANDSNDKSKKELAAFMKKTIRKELNAMSANKRKSEDSDIEDSESLNALDKVDLSGFNYGAMDDLKIDSDDETVSESSFHSAKSKTE